MERTVCSPYFSIPLLELECYDITAEFLPHPLSGRHIENTVYILLEFLQAGFIYYVTIKIKNHLYFILYI